MKLALKDFRCFHEPQAITVRPINILVGENSAGKSSFLAAARFLFDLLRRHSIASFNRDPFHLGAFEQLAHYRGGRFGRAKQFVFELQGALGKSPRAHNQLELFASKPLTAKEPNSFTLEIAFGDFKGQPAVQSVRFLAGSYGFQFSASDSFELRLSVPSQEEYVFKDPAAAGRFDFIQDVMAYMDYAVRDLRFLLRRGEAQAKLVNQQNADRFIAEVEYLSDLYRRAQRAVPSNVYASAPVRSKPERTYNPADLSVAPDGAHIPFIMAQLHAFDQEKWRSIEASMAEFGKASGLFDRVQVKQIGSTASGPFQIIVSLPGRKSNLIDVGYGVSQALPIVADVLRARSTLFLFQQPEVHLHPRAQAELGSFFARTAKERGHTLFIETHSDHLLDRIRMEVRDGKAISSDDVSILYFERRELDVEIHSLRIDQRGNIIGAPESYRKFFLQEEARSLGIGVE